MRLINHSVRPFGRLLLNAGALALLQTVCGSVLAAEQSGAQSQESAQATTRSDSGLYLVTFKTKNGQIRVVLPAGMRPGDAIVGSTILEPSGRKDAEKDANRSLLASYSLGLAGQMHSVQEPQQAWSLPADLASDTAILTLIDSAHRDVGNAVIPLHEQSHTRLETAVPATSGRIILPTKGAVRRPLVFNQAMPGGIEGLQVCIGDREARLLAASPRVYIVESPGDVTGKTTLKVKRGGELLAEGNFNNRRPSSANPWPYVIAVVVIVGVVIGLAAAKFAHDFNVFTPNAGPF
jgi:hypothetical protein